MTNETTIYENGQEVRIIHKSERENNLEHYNRAAELEKKLKEAPQELYSIDSLLHRLQMRNEAGILHRYEGFSELRRLQLLKIYAEESWFYHDIYTSLKTCGYSEEELDMFPYL